MRYMYYHHIMPKRIILMTIAFEEKSVKHIILLLKINKHQHDQRKCRLPRLVL